METTFKASDKLGDIVTNFPGASNIFKAYNIDFCCGGNRPLAAVAKQQNLNEEEILQKIHESFEEMSKLKRDNVEWRSVSSIEMIDHIVVTHHAYLQKELPILSEFVTKILRVHGPNHGDVLLQLHKLYHTLKMELDQHLIKEEEMVFPLIKQYEKNPSDELKAKIAYNINELESEHTAAGDILREMRDVTDNYTLPLDACRTYTLTFQKLEEMEADLFQHIHLENNIMFLRYTNND